MDLQKTDVDPSPRAAVKPRDSRQIAAWLEPQDVLLAAAGRDGAEIIKEAAVAIARRCGLQPTLVSDALWRREQAGSTALGKGFAIPHARIAGLDRPMTFYVRPATPVDFAAADGLAVTDILVILVPNDATSSGANEDHLRLLALVARLASQRRFRRHLRDAADVAAVTEAFREATARASDA